MAYAYFVFEMFLIVLVDGDGIVRAMFFLVGQEIFRSRVGLGGPGHGPVFGTPFGPRLGLSHGPVSVHLGHGSVRS